MRKYVERAVANPGLLVVTDKYSTTYYLCRHREDFGKAALLILEDRADADWYFDDEPEEDEKEKRELANQFGTVYVEPQLDLTATRVKQILKSKDGDAAFEFLWDRRDYEYEGFSIAPFTEF